MSLSCWLAIISLWKSITCISQSSPVEDKNKIKETIVSLSCYRPHLLCGDARPLRLLRSVQGVLSGWTARVAHPALGHHLPSAPALSPSSLLQWGLLFWRYSPHGCLWSRPLCLSVDVFLAGVQPMRPSWEQDARQRGAAPSRLSCCILIYQFL